MTFLRPAQEFFGRLPGQLSARSALLAASLAVSAAGPSEAAPPEIESIRPRAVRPGVPVQVELKGTGLAAATNLWTSFPASVEWRGEGRFRITALEACPAGIGLMRACGTNGISSAAFILIDDLATVASAASNSIPDAARILESGTAVEGRCDELAIQFFRMNVEKGQRIAIEVVATRIGSKLDSVLRVTDGQGKVLAQNDDALGLRGDSYLAFIADAPGEIVIELRDVNYSGGADFFYRMRVGDFDLATTTFPVATASRGKQRFELVGPAKSAGWVQAIAASNATVIPLAVPGRDGSTFASAMTSHGAELIEQEPNDAPKQSTRAVLFDGINGRFERAGDRDCYEFRARQGQRVEFRAATRSVGSPADVSLEIRSTDGKRLAASNPSAGDEGVVTHRFGSDGLYHLVVEELTAAFGPNYVYRIQSQIAPGFRLTLENDRFHAAAGDTFEIKVTCVRGDYKGPVTLLVQGAEGVLTVTNNIIAEGKTNATVKAMAQEGNHGPVRFLTVLGRARRDGVEVEARASTAPVWRKRFPQMLNVPPWLDGEVVLGTPDPR